MSIPTPALIGARADAKLKRERFLATLGEVQERLSPSTIARNAWDNVRDKSEEVAGQTVEFAIEKAERTADLAREKPAVAGAVAGALAAFIVRKPIARGIRRLFRRTVPKSHSTPETLGAIAARAGD